MPVKTDKRERLIQAAHALIHEKGYHRTTLADVASRSGVPLGNVYYYFKTKDDMAEAVLDNRAEGLTAQYRTWDEQPDPKARLLAAIDMMISTADGVSTYGCPLGSLCQELDKERSRLSSRADRILKEQISWTAEQFRQMGIADPEAAGRELVGRTQGAAFMGHLLDDPAALREQLERVRQWVESL